MDARPVLVTAPRGKVGRQVVRALLERGLKVRAGVRAPDGYSAPKGVEVVPFDFDDPSTFGTAVAGAMGLFLVRPIEVRKIGRTVNALVDAAASAGVEHCVFLSVAGAENQQRLPHRKIELHLEASSLGWTFLRPNHFMQNLTGPYRSAIAAGRLALPCGDGRLAFVDCADLGDVAARAFVEPHAHHGQAYELTGPEALDFGEVAERLTAVLDRPVVYEPIGALSYARSLRSSGAPLMEVLVLTGVHISVRRGAAAAITPTVEKVLGRPPGTLDSFLAAHVSVFTPSAQELAQ